MVDPVFSSVFAGITKDTGLVNVEDDDAVGDGVMLCCCCCCSIDFLFDIAVGGVPSLTSSCRVLNFSDVVADKASFFPPQK